MEVGRRGEEIPAPARSEEGEPIHSISWLSTSIEAFVLYSETVPGADDSFSGTADFARRNLHHWVPMRWLRAPRVSWGRRS